MTKAKLIEVINRAFPYSEQITEWDLDSEASAVRFTWRGWTFRVDDGLFTETVGDGVLCGGNEAILAEQLLKRVWQDMSGSRIAS